MKKILLILLINSFCLGLYAQNRKGEFLLSEGCEQHQLYFTLKSKYDFKGIFKRQEQLFKYLPELKPLLSSYDYSIMDAFPLQEQQLNNLESSAKLYSGSSASVNKLRNILRSISTNLQTKGYLHWHLNWKVWKVLIMQV